MVRSGFNFGWYISHESTDHCASEDIGLSYSRKCLSEVPTSSIVTSLLLKKDVVKSCWNTGPGSDTTTCWEWDILTTVIIGNGCKICLEGVTDCRTHPLLGLLKTFTLLLLLQGAVHKRRHQSRGREGGLPKDDHTL